MSQIHILMKKLVILKKIQVTMKTSAPLFFNHFGLSLKKITFGNESHEKVTKHIYASTASLIHIRIENLNWYKCKYCKTEGREIACPLL